MAFDTIIDGQQLENALIATASAIREKTGASEAITWDVNDGFAEAVRELTTKEMNPPGIIPADLKAAAMEVVNKVNAVRKSDSIVFMAMSDAHHTGEQNNTGWQTLTNLGNLHAGMAAKVISYALNLDFVCFLGDATFGHDTTTSEQLHQQVGELNGWLNEAWGGIPRLQTVGNHDTGYYAYVKGNAPMETNDYLFSAFGKYCDGATYGSNTYGYCYRDFDDKKLRVICLNTSEGDSLNASYECSPEQLLWFAQTLKSVGEKSGWGVIVLGHYPLDYDGMHDATAIVNAYVSGSSITLNGTTVNFSGSNNAKFIANFHGHTHCFKVAKLNTLNTSSKTATEYNAWRVGIPNLGFYRNNHQNENGPNTYGLYFREDTTYDKVNDGIHDTAFVVNVINPSDEVIHSFCYGAGYDRSIGYADIPWYQVTSELSNCTMTSTAVSIEQGKPFSAIIAPDDHCSISSVVITMGGVDITSSCYSEGQINIAAVTGNVTIKVSATIALACTNQLTISTSSTGATYGWKKGIRLGNTGEEVNSNSSYVTGFIPVKANDIVRLRNIKYEQVASGSLTAGYQKVVFYDSDKKFLGFSNSNSTAVQDREFDGNNLTKFTVKNFGNTGTAADLTMDELANVAYFRMNAAYIGDDSIITVNEEIKYADEVNTLIITNSLVNVTTKNTASTIEKGAAYNAVIVANSGYKLEYVTVVMDGVDITDTAYNNGVISIDSVTGNLIISAYASSETTNYTNVLPAATDTDGSIYNGKGYKENTYISGGNAAAKNGTYASGFIKCKPTDIVYFKNVDMQTGQDGHRVAFYDIDKTYLSGVKTSTSAFTGFTYGSDGKVSTLRIPSNNPSGIEFIRFCCDYIGDDSIVTINEQIE